MSIIKEVRNGETESTVRKMYHSPVRFSREEQESAGILPYRKVPGLGQGND